MGTAPLPAGQARISDDAAQPCEQSGAQTEGPGAIKNNNRQMLAEAVERIVQAVNPEQILLFGSQAWGQPTPDSDIDLLIIVSASHQPGYTRAREVYRSLRGIPLPIEVVVRTREEVTRAAQVISSLEHQALMRGQVLYE